MTEMKTETTREMPLQDQYMIVRSSIRSKFLGHALVLRGSLGRQQQRRCVCGELCIYNMDYNAPYIYLIKTIVNMSNKMMYAKIGVLDLCC